MYNEEGKKDRAKILFRSAVSFDKNYQEARNALKKLEESEVRGLKDWFEWWFGSTESTLKKILGILAWKLTDLFIHLFID